jgi:hypothetical protein
VSRSTRSTCLTRAESAEGFSLAELVISAAVTSIVSAIMVNGMLRLNDTHSTISNRTDLHAGVRGATELLQHEVSQAGRIVLPAAVTMAATAAGPQVVGVTSAADMFVGEQLVIDTGLNQETVSLATVDTAANTITAVFALAHVANTPVTVQGGFGTGIVPTTMANGSTSTVLKLYGDIHGNGHMVYVEYTCDTIGGNLYRNIVPFTATSKPKLAASQILLSNVWPNPGGAPCFTYQEKTVGGTTFVIDVAITLTLRTQFLDPVTNQFQTETKALLNVSPRNVFDAWQLESLSVTNRIQPMPASVQALLP